MLFDPGQDHRRAAADSNRPLPFQAADTTNESRTSAAPAEAREQHAGAAAIVLILGAEKPDEIALLVADSDQYVDRHASGQQQMTSGHCGDRPESEDEA